MYIYNTNGAHLVLGVSNRLLWQSDETALQMASRRGYGATLRVLKNAVHVSSLIELIERTRKAEVGWAC